MNASNQVTSTALTLPAEPAEQFRLIRLQTFNWGTFSDVVDMTIPEAGFLVVGPSGSGKSTILDAHAALLTPPKWAAFNVAARENERAGKDRNAMSYVRGAWAQQTGDSGEHVVQYLRSGSTWSAIAETYRNARGRTVVLAQVLWVAGKATASANIKKRYLVLERDFSVRELEFFPEGQFDVRRFKLALPDAFATDEFSAYQERFRRLLGIDNERALRLLHKTQSAKNLGDLNTFLRDFMLDEPETFAVADRLVAEFGELSAAHQAVVAARMQIETLKPARDEHGELDQARQTASELDEVRVGVDMYREQRRKELLEKNITALRVEADGVEQEVRRLTGIQEQEFGQLRDLQDRRFGLGGGLLEQLATQVDQAERDRDDCVVKRDRADKACHDLGVTLSDGAAAFAQLAESAKHRILSANSASENLEAQKDKLKDVQRDLNDKFQKARREIEAMERQRSNMPSRMLDIRSAIVDALGIAEDRLPFAGELLEVKPEHQSWQGAIERVLHGFALSLLVDDKHYPAVTAYLNERYIGERLVYLRLLPPAGTQRTVHADSLVRKLVIAQCPHAEWLREELSAGFNYECAETIQAFRNAPRAVTLQGQVKHGPSRHEKNDRFRLDDRSQWVLGFDNAKKLKLYRDYAADIGIRLAAVTQQLGDAKTEEDRQRNQLLACQTLANMTWVEVDVASALGKVSALIARIAAEKAKRPDLAKLDADIAAQDGLYEAAVKQRNEVDAMLTQKTMEIATNTSALAALRAEVVSIALTPMQQAGLDERFALLGKPVTLKSLDGLTTNVVQGIAADDKVLQARMAKLKNAIELRLAEFNRSWPAESGGLDATLDSAPDFFAKLTRLETDGLPKYEARFFALLRQQSDQNLTLLSTRLDQGRKAILDRLELVNDSLLNAEFNSGTHLVIEPFDKTIEDVRSFKQGLRDALSHSYSPGQAEQVVAEHRFTALSALVKRLSSAETPDRNWRALVLDVRQHVEFVAREFDDAGVEVEVYRSGAGKSGGQRQKLAATCLAAALRYQLGGQDRALPSFSTVLLDEAFDKADAEFTAMAMNIFKTFGFQMVVATPMKSVMTLEPFIGGACYVYIKDRKHSGVLMIDYDVESQRLRLPAHAQDAEEVATA